jgi:hypothetical protein
MVTGLIDVALPKEYRNGRLLFEQNLDDWRVASETGFENVNFNFQQLALDCFTNNYNFGNDGRQTINPSLLERINAIITGDTPIPGTSSPTFVINSGGSSATLSTINLTAPRTYFFPDVSGTFALLEATQTFTGVNTFSGDTIFNGVATFNGNIIFDGNITGIVTSIVSAATTENAFSVTANSLTTGRIAFFTSNSADVSSRALVQITNDNAAAASAICLSLDQDADSSTLEIASDSTTAQVIQIAHATTTGRALNIQDSTLTTGSIARFYSNSANVSARNLVSIVNDNAAADGAVTLFINQDADATSLKIDSESGTADVISIAAATSTADVLSITASSLTTGSIARFYSNSANVSARNLVSIINDSSFSVGSILLSLQQDSTGRIIEMTGGGNTAYFNSDCELYLPNNDPPTESDAFVSYSSVKVFVFWREGAPFFSFNLDSIGDDDGDGVYVVNFDIDFALSASYAAHVSWDNVNPFGDELFATLGDRTASDQTIELRDNVGGPTDGEFSYSAYGAQT